MSLEVRCKLMGYRLHARVMKHIIKILIVLLKQMLHLVMFERTCLVSFTLYDVTDKFLHLARHIAAVEHYISAHDI